MDYSWILNFQWIMYGFNLLMLLGVRLFGSEAGGASRWLDIGGFRFQPTELSKIIIILFFAKFFMDHEDDINTFKILAESAILLAVPLALIYAQPDMKNTITVTVIFCILLYVAGLSYKVIGGAILIAVPLAVIFLSIVVQPDQTLIKSYQRDRIMSFLYPENAEYQEDIEQQNNSKTAIASGELVGKRLTSDGYVSSVNEGNFVAENQTDFIFAVARRGVWIYRVHGHCDSASADFDRVHTNESSSQGSCGENTLLRGRQRGSHTELSEYLRCHRTCTEYRYAAALCKLRPDISDQSVYRYGTGDECRSAEQRIQ